MIYYWEYKRQGTRLIYLYLYIYLIYLMSFFNTGLHNGKQDVVPFSGSHGVFLVPSITLKLFIFNIFNPLINGLIISF